MATVETLKDLRLADLLTFLIVVRTGSVTAAGRAMKVTPSQASKAMARLEQHYRVKLLTRGPKGMSLTDEGRHVMPNIETAVGALAATAQVSDAALEVTLAGPSYLVGPSLAAIAEKQEKLRLRGMELAPTQIRATLTEGLFDMALSPGGVPGHPPSWRSEEVGAVRKILVGPPGVVGKPGKAISLDVARTLPFVGPIASMGGRFAPVADDCPLPMSERKIVHRVQTIGAALELAVRGRCVAFGPWIAARRFLRTGELVEIPVTGWNETERIALVCNGDVVREKLRVQIVTTLRAAFAE